MFPPAPGAEICVAGTQTDEWAGLAQKGIAMLLPGLSQRFGARVRLGLGLGRKAVGSVPNYGVEDWSFSI